MQEHERSQEFASEDVFQELYLDQEEFALVRHWRASEVAVDLGQFHGTSVSTKHNTLLTMSGYDAHKTVFDRFLALWGWRTELKNQWWITK